MWHYLVRNRNSLPPSDCPWLCNRAQGWRWIRLCVCALICRLGDCHRSVSRGAPGIQSSQQHYGWDQTETREGVSSIFMCYQYSDKEDGFEKLQNTAKKTMCCFPTPKNPFSKKKWMVRYSLQTGCYLPPQRMKIGCHFWLFSHNLHNHCHPSRI